MKMAPLQLYLQRAAAAAAVLLLAEPVLALWGNPRGTDDRGVATSAVGANDNMVRRAEIGKCVTAEASRQAPLWRAIKRSDFLCRRPT